MKRIQNARKGQAALDLLMLILGIVFVFFILNSGIMAQSSSTQAMRYEATQHQLTLLALLNSKSSIGGMSGSMLDMMVHCKCNGCAAQQQVWTRINSTLISLNSGQKHFILFISNFSGSSVTINDDKAQVCLDDITLAKLSYNSSCGALNITYGAWFKWENPKSPPC